jgi:methyl-accepting chemotaxis protein
MENHRKSIVVNKKVQYQGAVVTVAVVILAINFFVIAGSLYPLETGIAINFSTRQYAYLGLLEILLIGFGWRRSLVASHKLAGPVYAITREVKKLADGDLTGRVNLRPGDAFQEETSQINAGIENLRVQIDVFKTMVAELQEQTDTPSLIQGIQKLNKQMGNLVTVKED